MNRRTLTHIACVALLACGAGLARGQANMVVVEALDHAQAFAKAFDQVATVDGCTHGVIQG